MKIAIKILVVIFLLVVLVELLTREPYIVYDCREFEQYKNYPEYVVKECLKNRRGVVI